MYIVLPAFSAYVVVAGPAALHGRVFVLVGATHITGESVVLGEEELEHMLSLAGVIFLLVLDHLVLRGHLHLPILVQLHCLCPSLYFVHFPLFLLTRILNLHFVSYFEFWFLVLKAKVFYYFDIGLFVEVLLYLGP